VVAEIEHWKARYGDVEIEIIDDIFNLHEDRAIAVLDGLRQRLGRQRILFPNGLRTDIMSEAYIQAMDRAGTYFVAFAVESAVTRIQKVMGKRLRIDRAAHNIQRCAERGIMSHGLFMLGFPTETADERS
jgi:anaerobic magnesium-protoporphyrin IX monomethyl ester cyclase